MAGAEMIMARLKTMVPELGNRVFGAAEFAALAASGAVTQTTPCAHVIPSGIGGGKHQAQTGSYVQSIERLFSVILTLRTQDNSGARNLTRLSDLIEDIITAIAGWAMGERIGVMVFRRAALISANAGAFSYEISFSIADQLRIIPS